MADDKDKKLKEAEEALEKAQEEALKTPPPPVESFSRAQWNPELLRLSAGEGNKFEPTVSDASASNVYLPEGSNKEKIIANARNGKGKNTEEEKAANKIKRLAKQAAQRRQDSATKQAAYDRGVAERARQSKVDSEAVRAIRERHDKDKPSAWEMGLADLSGGLLGGVMGTYDRYMDSSRAANEEVKNFREKNKSDEAIRKALASAKSTSAGAAAASHGWNASAISAARNASSTLTSNAYSPHLFKEGTPNPLSGVGSNKDGDSKEQVRAWFTKRHTQAIKGNKKAIQEIGAASSRIAGKEELYKPYLQKDLVIADNRDTYEEKLYASVPPLLGEASEVMASIDYMWGDKVALNEQIETWETLNAYHQMFDVLAASAGPEGEYVDFAAKWASIKDNPSSPVFKSVAAMKDMAEKFKVTITSQQRNLRDVKDAGRRVTDIKAKIKRLEDNDNHDEAIWERENELPEAEQNLRLTLLFSGHSDLKVRSGEDGGVEVYSTDSEIDFPLIVSEYSEKFGLSYHVNEEKISQIEDPIKRKEVRVLAGIAKKEAGKNLFTDPPVTEKLEGRYASEAQLKDWANNNPSKAKELQRVIDGIVDKINSKQVTLLEVLNNAPQMEKELTQEERNMVRNFFGLGALKLLRSKAE